MSPRQMAQAGKDMARGEPLFTRPDKGGCGWESRSGHTVSPGRTGLGSVPSPGRPGAVLQLAGRQAGALESLLAAGSPGRSLEGQSDAKGAKLPRPSLGDSSAAGRTRGGVQEAGAQLCSLRKVTGLLWASVFKPAKWAGCANSKVLHRVHWWLSGTARVWTTGALPTGASVICRPWQTWRPKVGAGATLATGALESLPTTRV